MSDLETRKMLAEFKRPHYDLAIVRHRAGDALVVVGKFGTREFAEPLESDPAAACGLLPKLCELTCERPEWGDLWRALGDCAPSHWPKLIADAVKEVNENP